MKYINKFKTTSDFLNFKEAEMTNDAYVSYVEEIGSINIKPFSKPLITFYIKNGEIIAYNLHCEEGMTWEEFINSKYNTTNYFQIIGDTIRFDGSSGFISTENVSHGDFTYVVNKNSKIINLYTYYMLRDRLDE